MNIEELDALMAESTKQFNELKIEESTAQERLRQLDTALKQLQGEYEAYNTVKQTLVSRETVSQDPATVTPDPFKTKAKEPVNAAK